MAPGQPKRRDHGGRAARQGGAADRDPGTDERGKVAATGGGKDRGKHGGGTLVERRQAGAGTSAAKQEPATSWDGGMQGLVICEGEIAIKVAKRKDIPYDAIKMEVEAQRAVARACKEIGSSLRVPEVIAFAPNGQALLQRVDEEIRPLVLKHLKRINAPVIVMQRLPPIEEEAAESLFQRTYKIPFPQAKQDSDDLGDRAWLYTFTEHERDELQVINKPVVCACDVQEVFPHLEASSVARSVGELFARVVFGEGWRFRDVQLHLSGRSIWILDFGFCSPLDMDLRDAGAFKAIVPAQAIAADLQYLQNYLPREEREIWREFETAVKEAAGRYDNAGALLDRLF